MKKSWKWVLCLALAVVMLATTALAVAGTSTSGWTRAVDDATVTYNETTKKMTVSYSGSDLVSGEEYVLIMAKLKNSVDPETVDLATMTSASWEGLNSETVGYIDQNGTVSFTDFQPKSMVNSVVLLGGQFSGSATSPKVLGVVIAHGTTITGTVTLKGATAATEVTVEALDASGETLAETTATTAANGTGTYTLDGVPAEAVKLKVSTATKYVAREYAITADTTEQNVELWLKGDVNGDGRVNLSDYGLVLRHVKKTGVITDEYTLACSDTNGDTRVNLTDYGQILRHVKKTGSLW